MTVKAMDASARYLAALREEQAMEAELGERLDQARMVTRGANRELLVEWLREHRPDLRVGGLVYGWSSSQDSEPTVGKLSADANISVGEDGSVMGVQLLVHLLSGRRQSARFSDPGFPLYDIAALNDF